MPGRITPNRHTVTEPRACVTNKTKQTNIKGLRKKVNKMWLSYFFKNGIKKKRVYWYNGNALYVTRAYYFFNTTLKEWEECEF